MFCLADRPAVRGWGLEGRRAPLPVMRQWQQRGREAFLSKTKMETRDGERAFPHGAHERRPAAVGPRAGRGGGRARSDKRAKRKPLQVQVA